MQIQKAIQIFLQKNNLSKTLQTFKGEMKRTQVNPHSQKSQSQLSGINKFILNSSHAQQVRDHYQHTNTQTLKRVISKIKRNQTQSVEKVDMGVLSKLPFFIKLVEKENMNSSNENPQELDQSFSDLRESRSHIYSLEESCFLENEWEEENQIGYEEYQCPASELFVISEEISRVKNLSANAVKNVGYPEEYYKKHEARINRVAENLQDKKKTKLPTKICFPREENEKVYPLEDENKTYDSYNLKIIYDRQKTGFQQERELPIVINQVLAGRYQVIALLGQAQFSKVIQVKDLTNNKYYCIKIIQNNKSENSKEYFDQSIDEIKLLRYISANVNTEENHLLTLHDYFYHKEHLMLVTELLKDSLLDAYRMHPKHFDLKAIQNYARQVLVALEKLHSLHVIHNDLKPENILIKSYSKQELKVIDLGSGIFFHDPQSFNVQTLPYRSPEVLLGCPYDDKIDVWSLGCIVVELLIGEVLFSGLSQAKILAQIQGVRGPWPSWMLQMGQEVKKYFTNDLVIFQEYNPENKKKDQSQNNDSDTIKNYPTLYKIYSPKSTNLKARLKTENKIFLDFVSKCLKVDPTMRMSAKQALRHPFMTERLE